MCARISLAEIKKPLRFCNRYVSASGGQSDDGGASNAVLSGAANDLGSALATIDAYTGKPPSVTGVNVLLKVHRGADQAFMRSDLAAASACGRASGCACKVALQRVRGAKLTRTYTLQIPRDTRRAARRVRLVGQDADQGENAFTTIILGDDEEQNEGGDPGPSTLDELAEQVKATARYDGVGLRIGRARGEAFRDDDFRISGQAETTVRVRR